MKDAQLLRAYCERGCQDSFAELVRRHVSLVYGTARRQVNDPHVAEEICQKVFWTLAQNAETIRKPEQLPGWLYRTTRHLAAMHFRSEGRRLQREKLVAMNIDTMDQTESWNEIEPLLDQAMDSLAEIDRLAILLRFFRGNSMAEVGASLGVSEAAAKMRVGRALEKLRIFFSSYGITCSVVGLLALLHQNAAASAPPAVTASVLNSLGTLKVVAKVPATVQHASKAGFKIAAVIVAVGVAVSFFGSKRTRSNRAPDQRSNPALVTAAATVNANVAPQEPTDSDAQPVVSVTGIRLKVLDRDTLHPLAGVRVTATNLRNKLGDSVTDEKGECELPRPAPAAGDFYFRIRALNDGRPTMDISWSRFQRDEPSDIPSEYVLKIPQGVRVGGTVLDEEGHPLATVQIKVFGHGIYGGPPPRERPLLNDSSQELVTTDANGRWTFDRLPTEWDKVHFIVNTSTFLEADFVNDANDEGTIGQAKIQKEEFLGLRATLRLRHGLYLLGQVLDENGQPIADARVVQNYKWHEPHANVTTGNNGVYEIFNAPTGSLTLSIQAAHYSPQTLSLKVEGGPMTNASIILARGHVLRGRMIDADGNSVADAEVKAESPNRLKEFEWGTRTDVDGRFDWDGAPENPASYVFFKAGFRGKEAIWAANGSEQTVTLERLDEKAGIRVQGSVVNDESGQLVEKFQILVTEEGQDFGAAKEGTGGTFSLRLWSHSKSSSIEIRADGYAPSRIDNISNEDGDKTLEFRLQSFTGWNGQVLLPSGEPAVGAEVALSRQAGGPILGDRRLLFKEQSINRVADVNGRFHFDPVAETKNGPMGDGKNIVAVHPQGYAEKDVEQLARSPIIQLQPWGRIEGVLRSAGQALANERVCILKRTWNPWTPSINLYGEQFITITDASGSFTFDSVPPGEHALGHLVRGGLMESRATIQVNPGETTKVDVGGNGRAVLGHIVVPGREANFDFSYSRGQLTRRQAQPIDLPRAVRQRDFPNDEAYQKAAKEEAIKLIAHWQSAVGLAAWREYRAYAVWFDADGTFHADDIPAGDYELTVFLESPNQNNDFNSLPGPMLGIYSAPVAVAVKNASDENETAILGLVTLESKFK